MAVRHAVRDQEVAMLSPAVGMVELEDSGMARYIDVHMEDADYLSDSIDSADCSLSPMTDPDVMPTLSPMCKTELDLESSLHALDFMPSLSPAHESDLTPMESLDDLQAAHDVDKFDAEMTDASKSKSDNHVTFDSKNISSQKAMAQDHDNKFSEKLTAPKLAGMVHQTGAVKSSDKSDHIIPVYKGGSLKNKVVAFDFKEMNTKTNVSKTPFHSKDTNITSKTKDTDFEKLELDNGSNDMDVDDLPTSCKTFDTCGCERKSCRSADRCPSHHKIVADRHNNLVKYRKVVGRTPSAVNNGGMDIANDGHTGNRTRLKPRLNYKDLVVGNISVKVSDFLDVCRKGNIRKKDLEDKLMIIDNCDTSKESLRKPQTAIKNNNITSKHNDIADIKKCKNVTVDVVDVFKTGKRCNKLKTDGTGSSGIEANTVNLSLDEGKVNKSITKVLGGRELIVKLEDVIKDECAFFDAANLQDSTSGQVEQNDTIYVPVGSCMEKRSSHAVDTENTKCSPEIASYLKTNILQKINLERKYVKSGKYKKMETTKKGIKMGKCKQTGIISKRPVRKWLSHKKGQQKKKGTPKGPVRVNVLGRYSDFIENINASKIMPNIQNPSESVLDILSPSKPVPENCSPSKCIPDYQRPSNSVPDSPSPSNRVQEAQTSCESPQPVESDTEDPQGHFMHSLGLLETSRLPQVAHKVVTKVVPAVVPNVVSDDHQPVSKSTRVRKKTPKALALEQTKVTAQYRQYVKAVLREQRQRTEQFKKQTGTSRTCDEILENRNSTLDTNKKDNRRLDDIYELDETESEKQERLRIKKLIKLRFDVKTHTLAQQLKTKKDNVKKLTSEQPFPVLLIKATWNDRADKRISMIDTLNGAETETVGCRSNIVPIDGLVQPDSGTITEHTAQEVANIKTEINGEELGDTDKLAANTEMPESAMGLKISGEPWSLAQSAFLGNEDLGQFTVVKNMKSESELSDGNGLSVINSRQCDIGSLDEMASGVPNMVDIEGNEEILCESSEVPYTILRNDEYDDESTVDNMDNAVCADMDEVVISSDSEDDIDVITVDEAAGTLIKAHGKYLGELNGPNGRKDIVEFSCKKISHAYARNRGNESGFINLAETRAAVSALDDTNIMHQSDANSPRKPAYPFHDHNYCNTLGNMFVAYERSNLLNLPKKTESCKTKSIEVRIKDGKIQKLSKTKLKREEMPPMAMLLPAMNVPIVLSKTGEKNDEYDFWDEKEESDFESRERYHNYLERCRRKVTKGLFENLRDMLPELKGNDNVSKKAILKEARKCIARLEKELIDNELHYRQLKLEKRSLLLSLQDLQKIYLKDGVYVHAVPP